MLKSSWQFVGGRPVRNIVRAIEDIPATTKESDAMSRDLRKKRIFIRRYNDMLRFSCRQWVWSTTPDGLLSVPWGESGNKMKTPKETRN
jgi:hypothetical protein